MFDSMRTQSDVVKPGQIKRTHTVENNSVKNTILRRLVENKPKIIGDQQKKLNQGEGALLKNIADKEKEIAEAKRVRETKLKMTESFEFSDIKKTAEDLFHSVKKTEDDGNGYDGGNDDEL
jgi:hypothetical protein